MACCQSPRTPAISRAIILFASRRNNMCGHSGVMRMKTFARFAAMLAALAFATTVGTGAQTKSEETKNKDSKGTTVSGAAKTAGTATKDAAKATAKGTAQGAKAVGNTTAKGAEAGAKKVADSPVGDAAKKTSDKSTDVAKATASTTTKGAKATASGAKKV